jgi:hypothetical protein
VVVADLAQSAPTLGIVTAVAFGGWCALFVVMLLATQPRAVDAAPAALELAGDEPAAVVNLITHGWRLEHAAVPATLLDLAARGAATIERIDVDRFVVHPLTSTPPNMTPYETMVLDHVRSLATNGVVPCEALSTGPEEASSRWWTRFRTAVERDARNRCLAQARWSKTSLAVLGVAAVIPAAVGTVWLFALVQAASTAQDAQAPLALLAAPIFSWGMLMGLVSSRERPRETEQGLATASKWLGLRDALRGDDVFADLPPSAIVVWDRFLGYGAALGVAAGAVRALPLGSESDTEAWSAVGGTWRIVRVSYPRGLPPGWGRHPFGVVWRGLWLGALSWAAVFLLWPAVRDNRGDLVRAGTDHPIAWIDRAITIGRVAGTVLAGLVAVWALVLLFVGFADLFDHVHRSGRALRVRTRGSSGRNGRPRHYVAVDDGSTNRIRAWRLRSPMYVAQGDTVDAVVTRRVGYVRSLSIRADVVVTGADSTTYASPSVRPGHLLDASVVAAAIGGPVTVDQDAVYAASSNTLLAGTGAEVAAFSAADGNVVVTRVDSGGDEWYRNSVDRLPTIVRHDVRGVGDEATTILGHTLVARRADCLVTVTVAVRRLDRDARAAAMAALARAVLG